MSAKSKCIKFIKAIFPEDFSDAVGQPLLCGFPNDPKDKAPWKPKTMKDGKLPNTIRNNHNNYFTISTFLPDPNGKYRAMKSRGVAVNAIVLDDIGTKVTQEINLKPSWKIETSPGNFQLGFILKKPCKKLAIAEAVIKALGKEGFSDPGMAGVNRWARFPYGVNTKEEHREDGIAPNVRLVSLHPDRRYSMKQIIAAFGLEIEAGAKDHGNISSIVSDNSSDPVLAALKKAGLWKGRLEAGQHDVTCPWLRKHTDHVDHGTVYYEPGPENHQAGGFKCQHGHCSGRTIADLKKHLGIPGEKPTGKGSFNSALELFDNTVVFHDENHAPYCFINGHCFSIKSDEVRAHVMRTIHVHTGKPPKQNIVSEILATLESKAICEGEKITLHNRIAYHKGSIRYDLGNGRAVKVRRNGWEIVKARPLFRRYGHQQEQVTPISGGNPWKVFEFLNIAEDHQLETLVLLISYLVPDIPHPAFHPHGAQGSGKTTLCKIIKQLIDPSSMEVILAPKNMQELTRQISRHYLSLFDNVSKLDSEMSDILCLACTGGAIAKRALYTDDNDVIFKLKRCIGINGINLLISKPDLLDRTMLLHLERIPAKNRREESKLWVEFNKAKPEILGGMFDLLVKAMVMYPKVKLDELPRMADFAKWGYAIAEAMGKGLGKKFLSAYQANVRRQNAEVMQNNSLCLAVTLFMKSRGSWEGTVKTAYEELSQIVDTSKTDNTFPSNFRLLRKHLECLRTTLEDSEKITYVISDKPKRDGYHLSFYKRK